MMSVKLLPTDVKVLIIAPPLNPRTNGSVTIILKPVHRLSTLSYD